MKSVPKGSRWVQKRTGRIIVILDEEVHGTGPSWKYEDTCPYGESKDKCWHYCDIFDFVMWGEYERIGG